MYCVSVSVTVCNCSMVASSGWKVKRRLCTVFHWASLGVAVCNSRVSPCYHPSSVPAPDAHAIIEVCYGYTLVLCGPGNAVVLCFSQWRLHLLLIGDLPPAVALQELAAILVRKPDLV